MLHLHFTSIFAAATKIIDLINQIVFFLNATNIFEDKLFKHIFANLNFLRLLHFSFFYTYSMFVGIIYEKPVLQI
jgi:hypothetical protein